MRSKIFQLNDFNFHLPEELIAQYPSQRRDEARLFVLNRSDGTHKHSVISSIDKYLLKGDVLIFNNAKVINARLFCTRESGGKVEIILIRKLSEKKWHAISNRTKRIKIGEKLKVIKDRSVEIEITGRDGSIFEAATSVELEDDLLSEIGEVPLPPYINRTSEEIDKERYQTVYAEESGSVAAPTAGLHFTKELFENIHKKGVRTVFLTLYVSWGTFQPVRIDDIKQHKMHRERYFLPEKTAEIINHARAKGNRLIAVGTTSMRVLEATYNNGMNLPGKGETDIFIYPPYEIRSADVLLTNFHTPCSTLLMLVCAFGGYEKVMNAYKEAVDMKYRFFSYGDAMLIH